MATARTRNARRTVEQVLAEARARIDRVLASELAEEMAAGALVVDTRPLEQRVRDGELPGAVIIDRNVLEWRLDPASEWRIPETGYDRRVIVVCTEGYSSSLVAAGLRDLGIERAADLVDGYEAWAALAD
jgi:rhodanese-related sulfurtransferase